MSGLLALTWYEDGVEPSDPVVVCGTCELRQKTVQNAGHAFWDKFELPLASNKKRSGKPKDAEVEQEEKEETERERAFRERKEKRDREQKSKDGGLLKMSEDLKGLDLYELLEVEPSASADDLKKSYRKLVLQYHPDKMTDPTEEQKKHFLLLQEAFEIVSDPAKRRRYESTLAFDDSIPTDFHKDKDADFFEVFKPVFRNNARWSARSRVPDLGDSSTPIEAVKKFYDWWHDFESWRDPLAMAEQEDYELHCLEQAECREERRWMERQNAKVAQKLKEREHRRIVELVNYAEKYDPRMIAHREQVRAEADAKKAAKAAAKEAERLKMEEAERARQAAEEAIRKAEEEKRLAEKKLKDEQRNALKAARQSVKNLHRSAEPVFRRAVHADQLQQACLSLGVEELNALAKDLEKALKKGSPEKGYKKAEELLHSEIRKTGVNPIEDTKVRLDGDDQSTCSGDEADSVESEKRELTPEELAAEQQRKEAEEAAEKERREKKAEEMRKKRELQKKEDLKQQAAMQKEEKKAREAEKKALKKQEEKAAAEQRKGEEQKQKQIQQREEQRLAAQREEEEKKRLHEESLIARAFETDRNARLSVLEKDDLGLGDAVAAGDLVGVIRTNFLQEATGHQALDLRLALRKISASLPASEQIKPSMKAPDPKAQGKKAEAERKRYEEAKAEADAAEQARREEEEFFIDLAVACVTQNATQAEARGDAKSEFTRALVIALRPPQNTPELSKDCKARIKKQRMRIRMAFLKLMRQIVSEDRPAETQAPAAEAEPAPADSRESSVAIADGMSLVVTEEGPIFESPTSDTAIDTASVGATLTAAGSPVDVDGYGMVPLRPRGAVEVRIVKAVPPQASAKKSSKGGKKAKGNNGGAKAAEAKVEAAPKERELEGKLKEIVAIAAAGVGNEAAEPELLQAYLAGFDPAAALTAPRAAPVQVETQEAPVQEEAAAAPAEKVAEKTGKKAKKAGKEQPAGEEDLDALLSEFGVSSPGKKKKGKK
mmetsp:Transcript_118830/g.216168  ORF Transcript_118830/g.216168 Transcript_118830/m.216168 type:complete len:1005 (-) Transcript_118830:154-3168(-)